MWNKTSQKNIRNLVNTKRRQCLTVDKWHTFKCTCYLKVLFFQNLFRVIQVPITKPFCILLQHISRDLYNEGIGSTTRNRSLRKQGLPRHQFDRACAIPYLCTSAAAILKFSVVVVAVSLSWLILLTFFSFLYLLFSAINKVFALKWMLIFFPGMILF